MMAFPGGRFGQKIQLVTQALPSRTGPASEQLALRPIQKLLDPLVRLCRLHRVLSPRRLDERLPRLPRRYRSHHSSSCSLQNGSLRATSPPTSCPAAHRREASPSREGQTAMPGLRECVRVGVGRESDVQPMPTRRWPRPKLEQATSMDDLREVRIRKATRDVMRIFDKNKLNSMECRAVMAQIIAALSSMLLEKDRSAKNDRRHARGFDRGHMRPGARDSQIGERE